MTVGKVFLIIVVVIAFGFAFKLGAWVGEIRAKNDFVFYKDAVLRDLTDRVSRIEFFVRTVKYQGKAQVSNRQTTRRY